MTLHDWIKIAGILVLAANMALSAYLYTKARSTKAIDDLTESHTRLSASIVGHEARTRHACSSVLI